MSSKTDEMANPYTKRRKNIQEMMSKTSNKKIYVNKLVTILTICCVIFAIIPLGSILFEVIKANPSTLPKLPERQFHNLSLLQEAAQP